MASDSDTDELPSVDEQLLQAINILKLCGKVGETSLDCEEFDLSYALMAAVSLLEEAEVVGHDSRIIQAETIVKAVTVTHRADEQIGEHGFEPSWALDVAIDLIDDVIAGRAKQDSKKRRRGRKKAMREISTVDPAHARQFHRLLNAAGKLPVAELGRLARYAEIELSEARANVGALPKMPEPTAQARL